MSLVQLNNATLSWTTDNSCLPITSYNVFKNNLLIANIVNTSYTVSLNNASDSYYVISLSGNILSEASNIVNY